MTVVRINAITVSPGRGDELARRFAARAGAVDEAEGFLGFELLRPTDDRDTWLVVTHWRDDEAFQAWVRSPAFAHGHRGMAEGAPAHGQGHLHAGGEAGPSAEDGPSAGTAPVAASSELWSYDVVDLDRGR